MKPSLGSWRTPHSHRSWYSWPVLTNANICLKGNLAGCKKSRKLLLCTEAYFVMQVLDEPARRDVLLTCYSQTRRNLLKMWKSRAALAVAIMRVEFMILSGMSKTNSRITIHGLQKNRFCLVQDLVGNCCGGQRVQHSWLIFQDPILWDQGWSSPVAEIQGSVPEG